MMNHTQAVMSLVMAASQLDVEELAALRANQPDPMAEILGFGPESEN